MMQPLIELQHVTKRYRGYGSEVIALNDISLKVGAGEFVAITGPSGSGKSTLLHCMGLLDKPTEGKVIIEGKDTSRISGKDIALLRGRKIGFVFQSYNLIPRLTVIENVILPGLIIGEKREKLERKAIKLLKEVGILHRMNHRGAHLSGGEQQKAAIARALINDPIIILADEPTGALDTESSKEIMDLLREMNRSKGVTVVFVSHDPAMAKYGRRRLEMKDGSIVKDRKIA